VNGKVHEVARASLADSAVDVFGTMLPEPARVTEEAAATDGGGFSAIVGFAGTLSGFLVIRLNSGSARSIAGAMLGVEPEGADEMVRDALGELANMIAGGIKRRVTDAVSVPVQLSLPTVVEGRDYSVRGPGAAEASSIGVAGETYQAEIKLVLECQTPAGCTSGGGS
jgi:chemotaxis protein CheX